MPGERRNVALVYLPTTTTFCHYVGEPAELNQGLPPNGDRTPACQVHIRAARPGRGSPTSGTTQVLLSILMPVFVLATAGLLVTLIVLEWPSE